MDELQEALPLTREGLKRVEIYTDGACSGNPGPGGWGVLLRFGAYEKQLSGFEASTTNNRMEMQAVIEALSALKQSCQIVLTTDSTYVKNGITQWISGWKKNNWRKSDGKPVKNEDLWKKMDTLCQKHVIKWHWVRGHDGHHENEVVDQLARKAVQLGHLGK
ncbi:MAG: ribonuclease HI [Magnetococcus sp. DMHC-6]